MMEENTMIQVRPSRQLDGTILLTQNHQHFRLVLVRTRSGFLLGAIHRETQQLEERATRKQLIIYTIS